MKYIKHSGKQIGYQSNGKGTPVVLVHGFCEDSRVWEEFKLDLLEENFRVIVIDLPGFGQSETIPEISIEGMAETVAAVLEQLGLDQVTFIGHSMGGYVGLAFAEKYPDQLAGLGIFHSQAKADTADKKLIRQKSIDFIRRQGPILYVKQTIPALFAPNFINSNSFLIEKLTLWAACYDPEGITAALAAMKNRPDRSDVLRQIPCPVLFIIGKLDGAIPWENSMAQTHLPAVADIHILEKVGHMGMFEATKQTQGIVRQFVQFCQNQ